MLLLVLNRLIKAISEIHSIYKPRVENSVELECTLAYSVNSIQLTETLFPENPEYFMANAVSINFIVNLYFLEFLDIKD